jgi:hypothetical protein
MTNIFVSNSVCELLAQQLVEEQAEVIKHQGTVNNIKRTILKKKTEVIKKLVEGRMFKFEGKRVIVIEVSSFESEDGIFVMLSFAEDPVSVNKQTSLTKREKELLAKYSEAFKHCRRHFDEYWGSEALRAAYALGSLKHGISLLDERYWEFSFDKAKDSDFFKTSGITVDAFRGCGYENVLLEDTRVLNI